MDDERIGEVIRETKETRVKIFLNLDGEAPVRPTSCRSFVGFLLGSPSHALVRAVGSFRVGHRANYGELVAKLG